MALRYVPTIHAPGTGSIYLPPFDGKPVARRIMQLDEVDIPFGGPTTNLNLHVGWEISINARSFFSTPQLGLEFQDALDAIVIDGSGNARTLEFCEWEDSEANIARIYRGCYLAQVPTHGPGMFEGRRPYSIVLRTNDRARYTTFSDGSTPGTDGPWEKYYYGSTTATTGGEDDVITALQYKMTTQFYFDGALDLPANNLAMQRIGTVPGPSGATMRLTTLRCQGCGLAPITGVASIFRLSTTAYTSAGNGLNITIGATSRGGDVGTGSSVDFTAGDTIYCYVTTAGTHTDVNILAEFTKQ